MNIGEPIREYDVIPDELPEPVAPVENPKPAEQPAEVPA